MDPSSTQITISSEIVSVDTQPHQPPANNITHMDVALYKAAARGEIDEFSAFQGSQLESLLTPDHNTVLHVHLATYDPFDVLGTTFHNRVLPLVLELQDCIGMSDLIGELAFMFCRTLCRSWARNAKSTFKASFIEEIVNKCPSLLVQPNAEGQIPLHIAASNGHSYVVKFLINFKAKAPDHEDQEKQGTEMQSVREMLRMTDLESNTALHVAAQHGHLQVVKELLELEDADFQYAVNTNQETPLYIAARGGHHSLLAAMLEKFKSPNIGGPHGRTVLHAAAMAGDDKTTRIMFEKKLNLAKETDENGQTPLHYAAHLGHYLGVKELLKWDKSAAYIADTKWQMTPLLMAARQGHRLIVREIISSCPDCCEVVDKRGWNLLHFVAFRKGLSDLTIFLKYGDSKEYITTPYASIRNLKGKKDVLGITPLQVFDAYYESSSREELSGERINQMERVAKEKEVMEAPFRPIRDGKDALRTDKIKEQIAKLLEDIVNDEVAEKPEQIAKLLEDIVNDEVAEKPVRPIVNDDVMSNSEKDMEKTKEAQLVVATLIATVTLAAGITVPGGYKSENGPGQGTPFLIRDKAFKAFVISDALAFVFSLTAIAIHFSASITFSKNLLISFDLAAGCISYAVVAMVFAFITGTYSVLRPSPPLANSTCCIGLYFFVLVGLYILHQQSTLKRIGLV